MGGSRTGDGRVSDRRTRTVPQYRGVAWLILASALVLFLALRVRVVSMPFERDEGEYAYIAQRVPAGDAPYRAAFFQKTPGTVFVYAAAFEIFGQSVEAVHITLYVWSVLTAWLLSLLVRRLSDSLAAALSVLVFAVISVDPRLLATAANTEQFALLPVAAGLLTYLYARQTGRRVWWFACGAACIAAFWFKQVALAPAGVIAIWALGSLIAGGRRSAGRHLMNWFVWACGALAVSAPILAYLVLNNAWDDFVYCVFRHNMDYARRVSIGTGLDALYFRLGQQAPTFAVVWGLAMFGCISARRRDDADGTDGSDPSLAETAPARSPEPLVLPHPQWFLGVWLLLSFVAIASPLNFYQHYFVWWLLPLAALAGIGASRLIRLSARLGAVGWWSGCALAIAAIGAPTVVGNRSVWFADTTARMAAHMYGENVFAESPVIGEYIRTHSDRDDTVYILGSEAQILYHAQRRSATRYIIMYPLFGPYRDAARQQREVLEEVTRNRPKWILDVRLENSRTPDPNRPVELERQTSAMLLPGQGYILDGLAVPRSKHHRFDLYFGHDARLRVQQFGEPKAGILMYVRSRQ